MPFNVIMHLLHQQHLLVVRQGKSRLFAVLEAKFYLKNSAVEITFEKDADGRVISITLWKNGKTQTLKKLY